MIKKGFQNSLLIFLGLLSTILSIAQTRISAVYSVDNFKKNMDCSLRFSNDGHYVLEFSHYLSDDLITDQFLSYGDYTIKDNQIILTDKFLGFSMKMLLENDKWILIEQGFPFLYSLGSLPYWGENYSVIDSMSVPDPQKERENYKHLHKKSFPFSPGIYTDGKYVKLVSGYSFISVCKYWLHIRENKEYVLYYKDIFLSRGTWEREVNEIRLFDVCLQHTFYLMVSEEGLISKYLPTDYTGIQLTRK